MSFKDLVFQPFRDMQTMLNNSAKDYRESLDGDFAPMMKYTAITLVIATLFTFLAMYFISDLAGLTFLLFCSFIFLAWCVFALHKVWQRFSTFSIRTFRFVKPYMSEIGLAYLRRDIKIQYFGLEYFLRTVLDEPRPIKKGEKWMTWYKSLKPKQQFILAKFNIFICQTEMEFINSLDPDRMTTDAYLAFKKLYKWQMGELVRFEKLMNEAVKNLN